MTTHRQAGERMIRTTDEYEKMIESLTEVETKDEYDKMIEDCANTLVAENKRLRSMVRNYQQELESLRELNFLIINKYKILQQLEGFDEILGLIG